MIFFVGFEVFIVMKIQVIFWVVMLQSDIVGHHCFKGLHQIMQPKPKSQSHTLYIVCMETI